mgnify:FL=1|tara:strand:- start:1631 stop:1921 length:291 start_codon:yes stop_codon:yes gene_type:complete
MNLDNRNSKCNEVNDIIASFPGIDTPMICLHTFSNSITDPGIRGTDLASWLSDWHSDKWVAVCEAIDELIEEGAVAFLDDGNIYPTGYQGAIPQLM